MGQRYKIGGVFEKDGETSKNIIDGDIPVIGRTGYITLLEKSKHLYFFNCFRVRLFFL